MLKCYSDSWKKDYFQNQSWPYNSYRHKIALTNNSDCEYNLSSPDWHLEEKAIAFISALTGVNLITESWNQKKCAFPVTFSQSLFRSKISLFESSNVIFTGYKYSLRFLKTFKKKDIYSTQKFIHYSEYGTVMSGHWFTASPSQCCLGFFRILIPVIHFLNKLINLVSVEK